jgi:hypothetical protein
MDRQKGTGLVRFGGEKGTLVGACEVENKDECARTPDREHGYGGPLTYGGAMHDVVERSSPADCSLTELQNKDTLTSV